MSASVNSAIGAVPLGLLMEKSTMKICMREKAMVEESGPITVLMNSWVQAVIFMI